MPRIALWQSTVVYSAGILARKGLPCVSVAVVCAYAIPSWALTRPYFTVVVYMRTEPQFTCTILSWQATLRCSVGRCLETNIPAWCSQTATYGTCCNNTHARTQTHTHTHRHVCVPTAASPSYVAFGRVCPSLIKCHICATRACICESEEHIDVVVRCTRI